MENKVILQGRLTRKPELEQKGGFSYCEFTVAWSEKIKETEKKCFARCKAWRNTAEFVSKYFDKGQECVVEGQLLTESWEKDGQKNSATLIGVEKVHFCGSKASSKATESEQGFMDIPDNIDEQIPFN